MGKLEKLMCKLSIPMPRARVWLPEKLGNAASDQEASEATLAAALGGLAGKTFSCRKKAISWAKKKNLLPPCGAEEGLRWYEAAWMLFSFARAARVNIALPEATRIFDVADVTALPRWSLPAAQWGISSGLVQPEALSQGISTPELSGLLASFAAAVEDARQTPEKEYKIQLFGDSITDNTWGDCTTWVDFFPRRLADARLVLVNHAYGGGTLTAPDGSKNSVARLLPGMLHPDDDLVVAFALTNDFASGCAALGGQDSETCCTVWGAARYLSQAMGDKLLMVSPVRRHNYADLNRPVNEAGEPVNSAGWSLEQGARALEATAAQFGAQYLDLYFDPVFRREELEYTTIDGLHPNTLGDILIAARIYGKLRELLP